MDRLAGIQRKEIPAEQQHYFDEIANADTGFLPAVMKLLLYQPPLALAVHRVGELVRFETQVPRDVIELVVLTTARELDCKREWAVHVPQARRQNIREEVIQAIGHRQMPTGLTDEEMTLITFTQELLKNHRVPQDIFDKVQTRFGDVAMMELTALIGHYSLLATVMNAYDVEPNPEAEVLPV